MYGILETWFKQLNNKQVKKDRILPRTFESFSSKTFESSKIRFQNDRYGHCFLVSRLSILWQNAFLFWDLWDSAFLFWDL